MRRPRGARPSGSVAPRFTESGRRQERIPGALAALLALGSVQCAVAAVPHAHALESPDADTSGDDASVPPAPTSNDGALRSDGPELSEASSAGPLPCSSLPLCDGFESAAAGGMPDPQIWTIAQPDCTGTGTLTVDAMQAHSGTHSLRVDGGGGYCDHVFIANANAIASLGPQVYTRVFVRLASPLGAGHVTFLAMKDSADRGGDVRLGGQDMILMYNRQSDDATLPVLSPTGTGESVALAANAWTCIESHFDETAGTIDTWVDGHEVAGLVENGTPVADVSTQWLSQSGWAPALSDFRLGWESYSGQTMTLWFDDVALARERIGCGP